MASPSRNILLAVLAVAIGVAVLYMLDPTLGGMLPMKRAEGFAEEEEEDEDAAEPFANPPAQSMNGAPANQFATAKMDADIVVGNPNVSDSSPMPFASAEKPSNCYPKNQLAPQELLPNDPNSKWAQVNPMGSGDIAGKNFLNAGSLIGVNTVGQSLRNSSWDLRSEPPNPQVQVSPWMQSTIEPELSRRPLEIA